MSASLTTTVNSVGLPAVPERAVLPSYSPAITRALWLISADRAPEEAAKSEARNLLSAAAAMLRPPKAVQVDNWLARLNLGASQPISAEDFDARAPVIIDAVREFPAAAFTAETARDAVRRFKWFPGGQELAEFLEPYVRRIRVFERDLRRVATCALVDPPPRQEPSQAEREAVAAAIAGIPSARRGTAQEPERTIEEQIAALRGAA